MAVRGEEVASSIEAHVREAIERMVGRDPLLRRRRPGRRRLAAQGRPPERSGRRQLHLLPPAHPEVHRRAGRDAEGGAVPPPPPPPPRRRPPTPRASSERCRRWSAAKSQVDVLNALLEQCLAFGSRAALLILRGETFSGWKGVGFSAHGGNDEMVKRFNAAPGLIPRARPRAAQRARGDLGRRQSLHAPRRLRLASAPCSCRW